MPGACLWPSGVVGRGGMETEVECCGESGEGVVVPASRFTGGVSRVVVPALSPCAGATGSVVVVERLVASTMIVIPVTTTAHQADLEHTYLGTLRQTLANIHVCIIIHIDG